VGIKEWWYGKEKAVEEVDSFILSNQAVVNKDGVINPNFKGEVELKKIKFPIELGEEHPFDFKITEGLYKKMGFVNAVVNKYVDFVVGPGFYVESDDERATKIITEFMRDVNFDTLLRAWIKEGLVKNGVMEIGGKKDEVPKGLKVLDSTYMFMKRNEKGVVEGWNQYVGGFKKFDAKKVIPFESYQIAHLPIDRIGDDAYGLGIVYSAMFDVNNVLQLSKDEHMLMSRKANSPYDITMGKVVGDKYVKPSKEAITKMGKDLEWLNNKHEWVHDGLTEIKALDFGNIGDKFTGPLEHDVQMLFYDFQIPAVIMGMARVPEGLAKVQMDAFERRISSIQAEAEKVIENSIFKRILIANGIDAHVEFVWGRPSNTERYERLQKITELIKSPMISQSLKLLMEKDIVQLMEYDEKEFEEMSEEEEKKRELERTQPLVPGQNAEKPPFVPKKEELYVDEIIRKKGSEWCVFSHTTGKNLGCFPSKAGAEKRLAQLAKFKEHVCDDSCNHVEESDKYSDIDEWLGFNYKEYVENIENSIREFDFEVLAGTSGTEIAAGRLSSGQVRALKEVLREGFAKGLSMTEIARNIERRVKPTDLFKMEGGKVLKDANGVPIVSSPAGIRSMAIARSEITRLANMGAEKQFLKAGYTKERWVASYGARTCPECEALDNQIFTIGVDRPPLPLHTNCRCMVVPVTEVI